MSVLQKIEELSRRLVLDDPFTASVLLALEKKAVTGSKIRVNINKSGELLLEYDLEFLNKLVQGDKKLIDLQLGELKRQIFHLCLFHPLYRESKSNKKAFDLACEITMEYVVPEKEQSPDWQTVESVQKFINKSSRKTVELPTQKTALDYYDILSEFIVEELPEPRDNSQWEPGGDAGDDAEGCVFDVNLLEATLLSLVQEAANSSPGSVPNPIREWMNIMLKISKVNYKSYIKTIFTQAGMSNDVIYTRSKPNTRIPQFLGRKTKPAGKMLVYIDASGSMNNEQFNEAISEVNHLKKQLNVEVQVVQFSTIIHPADTYPANKKIPHIDRKDHGGTHFDIVVDHYNKQTYAKQCIVFTDGEDRVTIGSKRPNNMLWVVINTYDVDMNSLPGKKVMVNINKTINKL